MNLIADRQRQLVSAGMRPALEKPAPVPGPASLVSFPMCVGGWQNTNISGITTAYVDMFRMNASGEPWPIVFAGKIVALATTVTGGGGIGGTSYEQQVYVGGTATGLITSSAGTDASKITYLDYPVNPGDLITIREKRTGAINNLDAEGFVYVVLHGHVTPLATG